MYIFLPSEGYEFLEDEICDLLMFTPLAQVQGLTYNALKKYLFFKWIMQKIHILTPYGILHRQVSKEFDFRIAKDTVINDKNRI